MGGIGAQIHQHLVNLGLIRQHRPQVGGNFLFDFDGRWNGGPQQFDHLLENDCDVGGHFLGLALPGKCQDLFHQSFGAFAGFEDIADIALHPLVVDGVHLGQLGIT